MELSEADRLVVVDELTIRLAEAEELNTKVKAQGWSGTGVVGYEINRLKEVIAKLKGS